MSDSDLALGYEAKRDLCVKLEKQLTAVTAERDRYRKALEDAANSLFTIANSAGKDELMSDMLSVRGYANSRGTVAQQALAGKNEPVKKCGECQHIREFGCLARDPNEPACIDFDEEEKKC